MFKRLRRLAAMLTALILILSAVPASALVALDYNEHDAAKLRTFFELTNNMGIKNGVTINGSAYDPDSPATWTSCTWNDAGRLTRIAFDNNSSVGMLDLAGCEALTAISCPGCRLTGVSVAGCTSLTTLEVDLNRITSVDVTGCPNLSVLWVGGNKLTSLDVSHNVKLKRLNCNSGSIASLDLSACPLLTYLDCSDNRLTELTVTCCPLITELYCKNNLLTELDLSQCTGLYRLRALGNLFASLDISVMNGGKSYVLEAEGLGYVGTKCNINSTGTHTVATAKAAAGSTFYGWYMGDELITTSADIECVFGEETLLTAKFTVPQHTLTVDYVFEDGTEAAPAYTASLKEGAGFTVPSPVIEGFTADIEVVEGVMGKEDMSITVTYSPAQPILMGDVDGNGVVNSNDALYLLRYTLHLIPETEQLLLVGDADGNGIINSNDALYILRLTLGLITNA